MSDLASASSSGDSDEEGWLDVDAADGVESTTVVSLLDDCVFPDATAMLSYCWETHRFDFLGIRDRLCLDVYGTIKLINYIRGRVSEGLPVTADISAADIADERYLRPVLDDDGLIQCLDDLPEPPVRVQGQGQGQGQLSGQEAEALVPTDNDAAGAAQLRARNTELQDKLERLTEQFEKYQLAVELTLDRRWGDGEHLDHVDRAPLTTAAEHQQNLPAKGIQEDPGGYFESYSHNEIHETMLKDKVRTDAYRDFIYGNKHLFAGKVVLDIGCGTGILSMFCAKAGAKHVIAVDRSAIIDKARENVFHNGMGATITCLRGLVEDVKLPVDSVDIIVSEWMGYCLLYEAMLPSVLWARDRYLKPDGLLVPSHASLWIAPASDPDFVADHVAFWRDVYGFDMKAMQEGIHSEVHVRMAPKSTVCGSPSLFRMLDLHTVRSHDLAFTAGWRTCLGPDVESLDGFLVWFDMYFAASRTEKIVPGDATAKQWSSSSADRVGFTTGPWGKETHWKQGLLLGQWQADAEDLGQMAELSGDISFSVPDGDARALTLRVEWTGRLGQKANQSWALR